jgi:hypothetical protein
MTDKITNFYEKLPKHLKKDTVDKTFKNHHILPNSMICAIGGTGTGKSNFVMNMIQRMPNKFYKIMIFNPVSTDEPLLNLLQEKIPETELINDINELPSLSEFDEDKDEEKLMIVDDFINMNKKDFKKINEYFTGGRKAGFTVVALCQNYTSVPKVITRNCQYFILFRLNDNTTLNNIIRNHNIHDIDKEKFRHLYDESTSDPLSFFMIDLKGKDKNTHLRKNFLGHHKLT